MANQFTPCQAKCNDDNNDDDVNEFNNNGVQFNNSKDTNTTAEASEETF